MLPCGLFADGILWFFYHQISKISGCLQIFLQTWLPCTLGLRNHTDTTRALIRLTAFQSQQEVQARSKLEVLPWIHCFTPFFY